ncbi:unnamed protein product [Durusdinium trenchii]|uniref:Uncharacterized protein n=1 Tax=Durusdinium trenchii TaxID=1381693 RepID=A0ABP0M100_9DINO
MATSWNDLISSTETVKPADDVLKEAVQFLVDVAKLPNPNAASGVAEADLDKLQLPASLPASALIRCLVRSVEALDKARLAQATAKSALASTPVSAKLLASALAPSKVPDVADLLQQCGLSKLGFHVQADQSLYTTLQVASEEAKAQSRVPFTYVDLTSKEVLPLWLPADSVGGKFTLRDEEESKLVGHHSIGSLSDLSKALKGATATPRFFRNVQQWVAAFVRYATTAVATGQMTWPVVFGHLDVILQICEQEKIKGRAPYLAFLYDDLLRRQWARRADKRDPSLDIAMESQKIDKDILELARQRLSQVLQEVGIQDDVSQQMPSAATSSTTSSSADVARQLAAAEQAQKRADAASKKLSEVQAQLLAKSSAAASQDGGISKRQLKTHWFSKQNQRYAANLTIGLISAFFFFMYHVYTLIVNYGEPMMSKKEAEYISEIWDMYKSLNITPHPPEIAPFKVEQSHGFLGNYYRAAFPVTHSDIHIPDPHSIGFIGKDANSLSVTLRNFKLTEIHEEHPSDRHAAACLVVNEFHHFVRKLAKEMNPTNEVIYDINQRIQLIECFITRCNIAMHKYRPFLALMVRLKDELQQIMNLWPAFRTQQKLQEQIRNVKLHVDAALLRLLGYCFYVLKCEPGDFAFDPQDWHPEIRDTESVHDKIMHWLLLQDHVYNSATNHSVDREAWMLRLMDTGHEGDILHQMSDAWTDPSAMSEPVLAIGDMKGDESGLPSNIFAYETDMSPEQRRSAIELWLTLVREAVGTASFAEWRGAHLAREDRRSTALLLQGARRGPWATDSSRPCADSHT